MESSQNSKRSVSLLPGSSRRSGGRSLRGAACALLVLVALGLGSLDSPFEGPRAASADPVPCGPISIPEGVACNNDWMKELAGLREDEDGVDYISQIPLTKLLIPGSHNAGTYNIGDPADPLTAFAQNQSLDIRGQLYHGIRQFDLRFRPNNVSAADPDTPTGIFIFHGSVKTSPYSFAEVIDAISGFYSFSGHDREILLLNIQFDDNSSSTEATKKLLGEACTYLEEELGGRLIHPSDVSSGDNGSDASDWLSATTVQDIWDLPLSDKSLPKRIIATVRGGGLLECSSTFQSYLRWEDEVGGPFDLGSWFANQCYAEEYPFPGHPFPGITASTGAALESRARAAANSAGASFENVPGDPVDPFYNLGIQPTQSLGCLAVGAPLLEEENDFVLNAVKDWYVNDERKARRHLNVLSSDFVERTPLMSHIREMTKLGGATITASLTSGGEPYTPGEGSWANQVVSADLQCDSADQLVTLAYLGTGMTAPTSTMGMDLEETVEFADEGENTVKMACMDASGRVAVTHVADIFIDKTPPSISLVKPPTNDDGWYNTDVEVIWTCKDGLSGVEDDEFKVTVTAEEEDQTFTRTCTDLAGNTASATAMVSIDKTQPKVTCDAADEQWHNEDVFVECMATDMLSLLDVAPSPSTTFDFFLTTDVAAGTETADAATNKMEVCDVAGNCRTAGPVSGNKVDKKGPVVTCPAPPAFLIDQEGAQVMATFEDGGVGPDSGTATSAADTSAVGPFLVAVTAEDSLENATTVKCQYSVHGSASLAEVVGETGLSPNNQEALLAKVGRVDKLLTDGNSANDKAACNKLNAFLKHVAVLQKTGRLTTAEAQLLSEEAQLVRNLAGC